MLRSPDFGSSLHALVVAIWLGCSSCFLFVDFDQNAQGGAGGGGGGGVGSGAGGAGGEPSNGGSGAATVCAGDADCDGDPCTGGVCQAVLVAKVDTPNRIGTVGADDDTAAFILEDSAQNPLCTLDASSFAAQSPITCPADCHCSSYSPRWDASGTHIAVKDATAYYSPACAACQASNQPVIACGADACVPYESIPDPASNVTGLIIVGDDLVAIDHEHYRVLFSQLSPGPTAFQTALSPTPQDLSSIALAGPDAASRAYIASSGEASAPCVFSMTVGDLTSPRNTFPGAPACANGSEILNVASAGPDFGAAVALFENNETSFEVETDRSHPAISEALTGSVPYLAARDGYYYLWKQDKRAYRCTPPTTSGNECSALSPVVAKPGAIVVTERWVYIADETELYRAKR